MLLFILQSYAAAATAETLLSYEAQPAYTCGLAAVVLLFVLCNVATETPAA